MRRALNSAAGQTNRLLAFSRRQALQPELVQPDQFIAGIREFLQRTIGPEIRLSLLLGDGKWDIICDAHQLEGALMNLTINARDAMPDGGELTISVTDRKVTARDFADRGGSQARRLRRSLGLGYRRRHDSGNPQPSH